MPFRYGALMAGRLRAGTLIPARAKRNRIVAGQPAMRPRGGPPFGLKGMAERKYGSGDLRQDGQTHPPEISAELEQAVLELARAVARLLARQHHDAEVGPRPTRAHET